MKHQVLTPGPACYLLISLTPNLDQFDRAIQEGYDDTGTTPCYGNVF